MLPRLNSHFLEIWQTFPADITFFFAWASSESKQETQAVVEIAFTFLARVVVDFFFSLNHRWEDTSVKRGYDWWILGRGQKCFFYIFGAEREGKKCCQEGPSGETCCSKGSWGAARLWSSQNEQPNNRLKLKNNSILLMARNVSSTGMYDYLFAPNKKNKVYVENMPLSCFTLLTKIMFL